MALQLHQRGCHYAILVGVALLLFFWDLGTPTLWDIDEGRNSTASLEMLESRNWVVPTFNARLRSDKPVLLYWLQATAYRLFGVTEFSARLPSALAALGAVLLAYELGRSLFGKRTGFLGALIAASSPMLIGAARFANPDALLHFFTLLTLFLFWLGQRRPTSWWWMGLGAASGFGMLAKGPVALVLPSAVMLVFLIWEGRWRILLDRRWWWGALTWSLVALPWYIWVAVDTKGRFIERFFLRHNMERFLDPLEGHEGVPAFYVVVLFAGLAPWSIFLLGGWWFGFWSALTAPGPRWRRMWQSAADVKSLDRAESVPPRASAYRLLLSWIGVYLLFFSAAATKLPNYILPAVVPCAMLIARMLDRWRRDELAVGAWCMPMALALWLGLCVLTIVALVVAGGAVDVPGLSRQAIPGLASLAWLGAIPLLGVALGWRLLRQNRRGAVVVCLASATVATAGPLIAWAAAAVNQVKAPQPLVEQAGAFDRAEDLRIVACELTHLSSLNFYTQRGVIHLDSPDEVFGYLHFPIRVLVFLRADTWQRFTLQHPNTGRVVARGHDMYCGRDVVVVTNR
jgi:4-amino-4-deoxy-L-arabinose transferase-like glycosyltransferase